MGPGAAYTIDLPAGSYKAYVQTNTPAYPDQCIGGSSLADRDRHHRQRQHDPGPRPGQPPPTFTLSGHRHERRDAGQRDLRLRLRRGHLGLRRGGHDGPRRGLHDRPPRPAPTRPTSRPTRRPTPTSTSAARASTTATVITVSADTTQDLALVSPPTFTLSGHRHERRDAGQRDLRLRLRRGHLGLRRGGHDGPRRGLHDRPPRPAPTRPTSRPTRRPTPTSTSAARASTTATVITVSANTTQDLALVSAADVHPERAPSRAARRRSAGPSSTSSTRPPRPTSGRRRWAPARPTRSTSAAGSYKAYVQTNTPAYPDQYIGGSSLDDRDRHHGQRRHDPGPRPGQPADVHPERAPSRAARRRSAGPSSTSSTRPPRPTSGRPRWAPARPTRSTSAAGSYKAYVQTNTPAYPDQYIGGSSLETATVITVSADTTQDLALVSPPTFTLSGDVTSGATPVSGTFVYVFDAATSAYVGAATMGPGAAYTIDLRGRLLQGLRPDQHPGLPRPVHRRLEPRDRDRHHGQRRHDPGPRPGRLVSGPIRRPGRPKPELEIVKR